MGDDFSLCFNPDIFFVADIPLEFAAFPSTSIIPFYPLIVAI
jgi:hypothetical protein